MNSEIGNEIKGEMRVRVEGGAEKSEKGPKSEEIGPNIERTFRSGSASNAEHRIGEENGKHLSPALVPTTASRGEGGDCVVDGGERAENADVAGLSDFAAAGPSGTAALRGDNGAAQQHGPTDEGEFRELAAGKPPEPADRNVCPTDKVALRAVLLRRTYGGQGKFFSCSHMFSTVAAVLEKFLRDWRIAAFWQVAESGGAVRLRQEAMARQDGAKNWRHVAPYCAVLRLFPPFWKYFFSTKMRGGR